MTWFRSADRSPHGLVLAMTATIVLAGCTGGGETPPSPTPQSSQPTASATPTASPTPTPEPVASRPPVPEAPEPPAEMEGTGTIAGIETAEFFIEALNHGLASGDTTSLKALAADECGPCSKLINGISTLYDAGAWQEGGQITFTDATVPDDYATLDRLPVQFNVDQAASASIGADGTRHPGGQGRKYVMQVVVEKQSGRWLVVDVLDAK